MPLEPGLLSTTICWPSALLTSAAIRRVVVSVPLPAANGSTSVTLRVG
jgi:Ser/Thr protein kinase RdoA (MazF antagonist)